MMKRFLLLLSLVTACQDDSGPDGPIIGGGGLTSPDAAPYSAPTCKNTGEFLGSGQEDLTLDFKCNSDTGVGVSIVLAGSDRRTFLSPYDLVCGNNILKFPADRAMFATEVIGQHFDIVCQ